MYHCILHEGLQEKMLQHSESENVKEVYRSFKVSKAKLTFES